MSCMVYVVYMVNMVYMVYMVYMSMLVIPQLYNIASVHTVYPL